MKSKYKIVYRMAGGTITEMREFTNPSGVIYYLTQTIHPDAASVTIEDLETDMVATHDIKNGRPSINSIDGIKAFLGVA